MFDQILFPTDGSDGADVVFDHVLDLAITHDSTVHILNVADTTQESVVQIRGNVIDLLEREGEQVVQRAAAKAEERRVDTVTEVLQGQPYTTVVEYASARDMDLIVMPTHGRRGLERFLLGSTTERVVRRSEVPVLTIRPDDDSSIVHPYQDVLVPTDGSDCANQALALGVDVADAEGAALHLLSAIAIPILGIDVRPDIQMDQLERSAKELLTESAKFAEDAGVEVTSKTVDDGPSISKVILEYIEEHGVDLVVIGTHGRTGIDRYLLGSVTDYLVRTSPIPVLTVRPPLTEP